MTAKRKEEKLYLADAYMTSFEAVVVSCDPIADERFAVKLDATYFYPESGGQPGDKGLIADAEIVDVQEDEAGKVVHIVTAAVEGKVHCEIDWDIRFDHMQQHSGQHVLSRAFIEIAGMPTESFHMGDDSCTIDIKGKQMEEDKLDAVENLCNALVWEDRKILVQTIPVADLQEGAMRKSLPAGVSEARIVEVEDFDAVPCCGTHVRRTGELGSIKILKHEKVKNHIRVHYKAGRRAFWDYQDKHDVVKALASRYTTSLDGIIDKTDKLAGDMQQLRREYQKTAKKLVQLDKERILQAAGRSHDVRFAVQVCEDATEEYLNLLANACKNEPDTVVCLGSRKGHVVCATSVTLNIDFAKYIIDQAKEAGGKGGGKGGFARVSIPPAVDVDKFLQKVSNHVKKNL
ncbi:MAG: alanyl-tRNA editing protein [Candidatus Latescibacterota bacterium]